MTWQVCIKSVTEERCLGVIADLEGGAGVCQHCGQRRRLPVASTEGASMRRLTASTNASASKPVSMPAACQQHQQCQQLLLLVVIFKQCEYIYIVVPKCKGVCARHHHLSRR